MFAFVLRRLAAAVPVLAVVAVVAFLVLRLAPGDPAAVIAGNMATTDDIARIRTQLGLDASLPEQFVRWLGRALRGDLGESFFFGMPVSSLIAQRLEPTLALAAGTIVLAVAVAVPLGTLAAWRLGGWLDRALSVLSVLGFSVPVFVLAYGLIWLFALQWGVLPVQGYRRLADGVGPFLRHLALPSLTLGLVYVALIARIARAAVSEALTEDWVRTARAKGLAESRVLVRHALANAAVPIVTVVGIGVGLLIGGVVVTETVFAIPGLGSLMVEAVLNRDFPVVQGVLLTFSVAYVLVNLAVDLSYLLLDPRIRH